MSHLPDKAGLARGMPDEDAFAHCEWMVGGERVQLLADRALYWPARQRLVLADLHLGKEDTFRRAGLAVPEGVTRTDLARLSALLQQTGASSLWILGDLLHGPVAGQAWRAAWAEFRARHADLEVCLVAGNHDRHIASAGLDVVVASADVVQDGPLVFTHEPQAGLTRPGQLVLAGHLHPVVHVSAFRRAFPAFVFHEGQLVLPAFSAFTGGLRIRSAQRIAACLDGHVLDLGPWPARRSLRNGHGRAPDGRTG